MKQEPGITEDKRGTLVILTPGFPKDEHDSTCLPAQQAFVRALNRHYPDLQIIILAFEYPFSRQTYLWHQNKVIPFDGWNKGRIKKISVWISAWRVLQRLRKENRLLGLLSFWCTGCALVGTWYGRMHRLRHFAWILGQDARANNRYPSLIRPRADELIAMSESLAREFQKNHGVHPRHLVTNGIDPSLFPPSGFSPDSEDNRNGHSRRDIDVLGVGSLIPLKQYGLFLSAIKQLSTQMPGIRSFICGKGPEEEALRATIREWQLQDEVTLTGELPHDEVLGLMQRSRVFLHTSSYEGFSTVCLEALYAGAHVVSICQPMSSPVRHWHVVTGLEQLTAQVQAILEDAEQDHLPVMVYSMEDCARKMMELFD